MSKFWDKYSSWKEAEENWDQRAHEMEQKKPIKKLHVLPQMVGITSETAKKLKWKSFKWMLLKDTTGELRRGFFRHPWKYTKAYIRSLLKVKSYKRRGDFFLYNIDTIDEFKKWLTKEETLFVLGFSYCHKPFECPSGRFTDQCIHRLENPVCQQCFIGKAVHAAPSQHTITLFIPTVHYIGAKIFELINLYPNKQIIFLITACELTLEMFSDWGNMVNLKGVGVRLDGRICNTMKAFALSEQGIKPGLTVVLDDTQKQMLELIRIRREYESARRINTK